MCTHNVSFGEEQSLFDQYPTTWKVEPYDNPGQSKPSTYVSFVFHYRDPGMWSLEMLTRWLTPLAFLHAQGIIEDPIISAAPVEGENPAQQTVDTPTNTAPARLSPPVDTENPVYYHIVSASIWRNWHNVHNNIRVLNAWNSRIWSSIDLSTQKLKRERK